MDAAHGLDEAARLAALHALGILDSTPEPAFDALVHAASLACGVPIALISLVDAERQWFKASCGLPGMTETPRDRAFCAHTILGDDILEVTDATADPRFAGNPLVTGHPDIRFYAGVPLRLRDGAAVGTLCVIDRQARRLEDKQRTILRSLAASVSATLESCRSHNALLRLLRDSDVVRTARLQAEQERARERERHANMFAATGVGTWEWHVPTGALRFSRPWAAIIGYEPEELAGAQVDLVRDALHPEDEAKRAAEIERHFAGLTAHYESEVRFRHRLGHFVWVQSRGALVSRTPDGTPEWVFGTGRRLGAGHRGRCLDMDGGDLPHPWPARRNQAGYERGARVL